MESVFNSQQPPIRVSGEILVYHKVNPAYKTFTPSHGRLADTASSNTSTLTPDRYFDSSLPRST